MHVMSVRNVTEALPLGVNWLLTRGRREESRAGPVLVSPVPVTTVYGRPRERVLFAAGRDANPFFHLAEALWMLAGRNDAQFLNNFVTDFGERYAESHSGSANWEEGGVVHDAYGRRWRRHFSGCADQLDVIVRMLRRDHTTRQAVLAMWDPTDVVLPVDEGNGNVGEEYLGGNDLLGEWKTRPCNTHAYFRIREEPEIRGGDRTSDPLLEMVVCCRSNDIVWGAYGANAVHFSFLQEYVAQMVGVQVGRMWQMSWNYHVYLDELERLTKRGRAIHEACQDGVDDRAALMRGLNDERYYRSMQSYDPPPLVGDSKTFDAECEHLLALYDELEIKTPVKEASEQVDNFRNRFLAEVAWPMMMAHRHRRKASECDYWIARVEAQDWRQAGLEWIARRRSARAKIEWAPCGECASPIDCGSWRACEKGKVHEAAP